MNSWLKKGLIFAFGLAAGIALDVAYLTSRAKSLQDEIRKEGYEPVSVTINLFGENTFVAKTPSGTVVTGTDNVFLGNADPQYNLDQAFRSNATRPYNRTDRPKNPERKWQPHPVRENKNPPKSIH